MKEKYHNIGNPPELLIEECAEVIHAICKGLRFGWHEWHPDDKNKLPNYQHVIEEIDDLIIRINEFSSWIKKEYIV